MANNEYSFTTEWRFQARAEEVTAILGDGASLSRWWPSVYLAVQELEPGDERGIGKLVDLHTKGWLPYTLRWRLKVVEIRDDGFTIEASGDFDGRGDWYFTQQGPETIVRYDWNIRAEKPLLRYLSPVLKPIFAANHHWAMAQGQRSLELRAGPPAGPHRRRARRHPATARRLERVAAAADRGTGRCRGSHRLVALASSIAPRPALWAGFDGRGW